ncbi:hypothetical protein N0V82_008932 [Gnomoniopsis sp. IMI 355080]|nr:hypothetical protein N0V82_008932 [Gnomoniopsis sp. IMI 355080]
MITTQGSLPSWLGRLWTTVSEKLINPPRPLECRASDPLPLVVEDITPAWLSKILKVKVETLRFQEVIHGSASKVLVEVTYSKSRNLPPTHLCIKGGFNPQLVDLLPMLFGVYRLEAQFYHHIAPQIPGLYLLPAYWAGVDHPSGKGQGIIVLKDVKADGYSFGDPLQTWPVERVRAALSQLATLHASTWGAKQAELPWVPREFGLRDVIKGMMSPESWDARFADPAVRPPIPEIFWRDRERIVKCMETLWATTDEKMLCMVHGDTQVGNTFIDMNGRPGFLDWQGIHVSSAAHDVTYFMTGALTVDDRREHERLLYGFYLSELHRAGGPKFDVEDVWDEYRKYQMQGFAWALAGPMMQPKEVVDAISQRHCVAILDHQSIELLESLV